MVLEEQIKTLSELGLHLNPGVTIDDVLYSFDRAEYEVDPFDLILFIYGSDIEREPWGRNFCARVWNFDTECIGGNGDYIDIVKNFARVAEVSERLSHLKDCIDFESGRGWVSYELDGELRRFDLVVDYDWADPEIIAAITADLVPTGMSFYAKDNGQASIWFCLDEDTAEKLNTLTNGALMLA